MTTFTSVCPCCSKTVKDNCGAIECDLCKKWFHLKCSLLSSKSKKHYSITNNVWLCTLCKSEVFPFHNPNNPEIIEISFNSNAVCLCSKHISNLKLGSLPRLEVLSSIRRIPNLSDLDVDEHLPLQSNFKYYTTHDFHSSKELDCSFTNNSFSTIHCNIRSLAANFDNLTNMLEELQHPFSLIGLSETKINIDQDQIPNNRLTGYKFISQPSFSNAGGTGLFIQDKLHYTKREDLTTSKKEFEVLWIEMNNNSHRNIICGVIYRHPSACIETFLDYLQHVIEKINRENKYCPIITYKKKH